MKWFGENRSTQEDCSAQRRVENQLYGRPPHGDGRGERPAPRTQVDVLRAVQAFNTFTPDNDPYGEHDFGRVEVGDCFVFWKIDYYDETLRYSSEDPADPALTVRVLTIMLTEEY